MKACTFLLTGDLHGRFPKSLEEAIRLHSGEENRVLLDAGDAIEAGNLGPGRPKSPMLTRMNELGYAAMAMGNRESHPFLKILKRKLAAAEFPVLAANLMAKRQPLPRQVKEFLRLQLPNGLNLGIIGLAPQITTPASWWSRVTDYVFDVPEKTAAGLIAKLRREIDVLVLLSHCGLETDRKLAGLEGVDLVLGGHSHIEIIDRNCPAPIIHSGFAGKSIAIVEVKLPCRESKKIDAQIKRLSGHAKN